MKGTEKDVSKIPMMTSIRNGTLDEIKRRWEGSEGGGGWGRMERAAENVGLLLL